MAYDEGLAQRVREALSERPDLSERKMFGGLCFMLGGNMCTGIVGEELMLRVGPDSYEDALVLCSQSLFRFADLGDDGLCRGGPDKGCGVIVSAIDVVVDRLD